MNDFEIRSPKPEELAQVQALRHAVLDPARVVEADRELTPADFAETTMHMAAFKAGNIIGTVRLDLVSESPNTYEVRKMAVDPAVRNRGVGSRVLEAALAEAERHRAADFTLDARKEAVAFFEKLGFTATGQEIIHADGVKNYVMTRAVSMGTNEL